MDIIKKFFREFFKVIHEAIWGYCIGIFIFTLIGIALKEMLRVFSELGYLQFAGIASGLILILGIIDYFGDYDIFLEISEFIESLFGGRPDER